MLTDASAEQSVYLAWGSTDMRKSIDGLAALVTTRIYSTFRSAKVEYISMLLTLTMRVSSCRTLWYYMVKVSAK